MFYISAAPSAVTSEAILILPIEPFQLGSGILCRSYELRGFHHFFFFHRQKSDHGAPRSHMYRLRMK